MHGLLAGCTDEELLRLAREGGAEAYSELWRRYVKAALTAARQYGRFADAEDLVSEAYTVIFRALLTGHGPTEEFRPYLYVTIRNLGIRERRHDYHRAGPTIDDLADELRAGVRSADDETEELRLVVIAFRQLPERWRTVLVCSVVEGRTPMEISQLMDVSPAAVAVLAFRARAALREAWLAAHLTSDGVSLECRPVWSRLARYVMGTLTSRSSDRVAVHLLSCARCGNGVHELRKHCRNRVILDRIV